jgi:phospholipid/cholesterol/gamma-HCH transport system substrate-binding protein
VASDAGDVTRTGLKPLLENINKQVALLGVMLEDDIPTLLNQLSTTASVAAERAPVILADLESFIESLNATSAKVDEILNARNISLVNSSLENIEEGTGNFVAIAGDLQATSTNIDSMINAINEVVSGNKDNLDKTLVDLRYSMESVARHVDAISRNLEGSSRHMYEFSRQIRLNPGLLLGGKPPRDEAVAVERAQ